MRQPIVAALLLALVTACAGGGTGCPEGASERGSTPPFGRALWCERPDGTLHGRQLLWYRYGHVLAEAGFRAGVLDGRLQYQDARGWRRRELHFENDELHGPARAWWPGGKLRSERTYRQGELHGPARDWREDGSPAWEGSFDHGRPSGRWIWRDTQGDVTKVMTWRTSATLERLRDGRTLEARELESADEISREASER
jgi:hypothetical protein